MKAIDSKLAQVRSRSPFSRRSKLARLLWGAVYLLLFRPSPRAMHGWRRMLLRLFGASVSSTAHIYPGARIWAPWNLRIGLLVGIADDAVLYSQGEIVLEDYVTVSQEAYLCTGSHDYRVDGFPLWTARIHIKRNAWVAARAFIHPGVSVGEHAIVGACAVVTKNVPDGAVVSGNPAIIIRIRDEYNQNRS